MSKQLRYYYRKQICELTGVSPDGIVDIDTLKAMLRDARSKDKVSKAVIPVAEPDPLEQKKLFSGALPNKKEQNEAGLDERANEHLEDFWETIEHIRNEEMQKVRPKDLLHGGAGELVAVVPVESTHVYDGRGLYPKESYEVYLERKGRQKKKDSSWRF